MIARLLIFLLRGSSEVSETFGDSSLRTLSLSSTGGSREGEKEAKEPRRSFDGPLETYQYSRYCLLFPFLDAEFIY